jgi:inosine triphosphate pyrophosphatase|eukprot:evm.model.NODE_31977_length_99932_cov_29.870142.12
MVEAYEDRSARAICNVGFSPGPGQQPLIFTGITYGEIVLPEEDDNGFGWDTCFRPSGFTTTFSKMTVNEKNAISHRSLALRQFQQYIADNWGEGGFEERGIFK